MIINVLSRTIDTTLGIPYWKFAISNTDADFVILNNFYLKVSNGYDHLPVSAAIYSWQTDPPAFRTTWDVFSGAGDEGTMSIWMMVTEDQIFQMTSINEIVFDIEIQQPISPSFTPPNGEVLVDIIMTKSPYWVNYSSTPENYTYIEIDLYIWNGNFVSVPDYPNYTLTAYKVTPTSSGIHVNIADYIADLINPKPNSSFYNTSASPSFNEFVNFGYQIRAYYTIGLVNQLVDTVNSDLKMATLGYGYHQQGINPKMSLLIDASTTTIDSVLISIDSGDVTIDSTGLPKILDNTYKYHTHNTFVYNAQINRTATGAYDLLTRSFTQTYQLVCSGANKPYQVMYLDRNGILDTFTFPRTSKRSVKFKSEKYTKMVQEPWDYDTSERTSAISNKNGEVNWTVNTDLLDEINVNYIEQLMASDRHWIIDYDKESFIPINLTDSDFIEKTAINDKAKIQYTLSFVEANDYINNIK